VKKALNGEIKAAQNIAVTVAAAAAQCEGALVTGQIGISGSVGF
jgi:hypothetical protein